MANYILAIDQGTTGTTVCLVNENGLLIDKVGKEFEQIYPKPGWVEHRPDDIWSSTVSSIQNLLEKTQIDKKKIACIGITNQRETVLLWDQKTGRPIHNAIVWQCRRTTSFCEKLKKKGLARKLKNKTGLVIDPYFSASKVHWLLKNVSEARQKAKQGQVQAGTIDSYLLWKLTNGQVHKTDVSNASRTQLMNIKTNKWDKELLKIFSVPENILPEIVPSSGEMGRTQNIPGLPDGIPISGMAGDQQAALFGQTCFRVGDAKCTFGTGSFILMTAGQKYVSSKKGILTTLAWQLKNQSHPVYALEGGAFICGAAVQWLRDGLKIIEKTDDVEALAESVEDSAEVEFVPALAGLGAPYWDPNARGLISGLTRGSTRAHIARATLEAMALQNVDILHAMENSLGQKMKVLRVDGGASSNNLLMQLQSDYLGRKTQRPTMTETTVAGAAYLAGLGVDLWTSPQDISKVWNIDLEFTPRLKAASRRKRLEHWHQAVKRARI